MRIFITLFFLKLFLLNSVLAQVIVIDKRPDCDDPSFDLRLEFEGNEVNRLDWEEWRTHKGKHYYKSINKVSFLDAKRIADDLRGYLATCNDEVINHQIRQILPTEHWIGYLQDPTAPDYNEPLSADGGFYWMSGAERGFTAWAKKIGEPNNYENNNPGKYTVQGCYPEDLDLWCDEGDDKLAFALIESDFIFEKTKNAKVKRILWTTGDSTEIIKITDKSIDKVGVEILFDDGKKVTKQLDLSYYRIEIPKDTLILRENIPFNEEIQLEAQNKGDYFYDWKPEIGLDSYLNAQVIHQFKKDIIYTLNIRTKKGCTAKEVYELKGIRVSETLDEILLPEIFSPNEDGINDDFYIEVLDFINDFKIQIFDPQGKMIFESSETNFKWDGKFGGTYLKSGLYGIFVRYKINGQMKEFTRPLVIQR